MKTYQTEDTLHGRGKATPKPKGPNPHSYKPGWMPASKETLRKANEDYTHDGTKIIRRHLPLNRRPSRRSLKRNAAVIVGREVK